MARFADKWSHRLPRDVRGPRERLVSYFDHRGEKASA